MIYETITRWFIQIRQKNLLHLGPLDKLYYKKIVNILLFSDSRIKKKFHSILMAYIFFDFVQSPQIHGLCIKNASVRHIFNVYKWKPHLDLIFDLCSVMGTLTHKF